MKPTWLAMSAYCNNDSSFLCHYTTHRLCNKLKSKKQRHAFINKLIDINKSNCLRKEVALWSGGAGDDVSYQMAAG